MLDYFLFYIDAATFVVVTILAQTIKWVALFEPVLWFWVAATISCLWFSGKGSIPVDLTLRKTIPFVEDECISGTDTAVVIGGLTRLLVCDWWFCNEMEVLAIALHFAFL